MGMVHSMVSRGTLLVFGLSATEVWQDLSWCQVLRKGMGIFLGTVGLPFVWMLPLPSS